MTSIFTPWGYSQFRYFHQQPEDNAALCDEMGSLNYALLCATLLYLQHFVAAYTYISTGSACLKRDGTRAETRFSLSTKRTSPFKLTGWGRGESVQLTTGSRGVRNSSSNGSNAGYTMFRGRVQDYWLPTPLSCFPFTSPTVRHRVPSGFN